MYIQKKLKDAEFYRQSMMVAAAVIGKMYSLARSRLGTLNFSQTNLYQGH